MPVTTSFEFFIQWHLTERCNLRCTHCYQTARTGELSFPEIRDCIEEIADMFEEWAALYGFTFAKSFSLTGGEPFLREDLIDVVHEIRKYGIPVYLLTNGTLITPEKAKALSDLELRGVQVSIEGPEKIHDRIRGEGSFQASLRGIESLLKAGLRVTLNATLSDINADAFMELADLAETIGVQRLGFARLVPYGSGAILSTHMIQKERLQELYRTISERGQNTLEVVSGDPLYSQWTTKDTHEKQDAPLGGCAAGISGLTLLADGTITPCRRLAIPLGNIRNDSLREIWAGSEVLQQLREKKNYKGKCGSCSRWSTCRGCRAVAYAYSCLYGEHDFLAEDPQCFLTAGPEKQGQ